MTRREELLALADRVEAAIAEQQSYMLELAYQEIHGIYPGTHISLPSHALRFGRMVRCEAYESAAVFLAGDCCWRLEQNPIAGPCAVADDTDAYAATPALALTAATLRALAESEQ